MSSASQKKHINHIFASIAMLATAFFVGNTSIAFAYENDATTMYDEVGRKPVLIIRFERDNVFFKNALKKTVDAVNSAKSSPRYEVLSIIPNDVSQGRTGSASISTQLRSFIIELNKLGVPIENISFREERDSNTAFQEIDVFVK